MSCSTLAAASGSSAAAADVCPAAGRTGRRSSSAASPSNEESNLQNSACCAAVADDPLIAASSCLHVLRYGLSPAHHIDLHPFSKVMDPTCRHRSRTPQPTTVVVPCFGVSAVVGGSFIIGNAKTPPPKSGQVICCCRSARRWGCFPYAASVGSPAPLLAATASVALSTASVGSASSVRSPGPSSRPRRRRTGSVRRKNYPDLRQRCVNIAGAAN